MTRKTRTCALSLAATVTALSGCSVFAQADAPVAEHRILVLTMSAAGAAHVITDSTLAASPAALTLPPPVADGHSLNYAVIDSGGRLLYEAAIDNPFEVRSPLPLPGEPAEPHRQVVMPQGEYLLRMPYDPSAATLKIALGTTPAPAVATDAASASPPPGTLTFSLEPWVRAAEEKTAAGR